MHVSRSLSEISEARYSHSMQKVGRGLLSQTMGEIEESPYSKKAEFVRKKQKESRGTLSGATPLSADQAGMGMKEGELPQIPGYFNLRKPEKQWTAEQLKYIDKYASHSLEAALKNKTALISDLQLDLQKCKNELKQIHDEAQNSQSPSLETHAYASAQHLKLIEKTIEQSKKLKELVVENKRLTTRVKELERLFLNAKTKLDQTDSKMLRLSKDLAATREKQEDLVVLNEYYRTMKLKAIHLMGQMTKPPTEKRELNLRFMELDDSQMPILVEILKQCPYAESLDLEGNQITDSGVKVLSVHLKSFHCRVATINLDWNDINIDGAWALAEAIMGRDYEIENNIAKVSQLDPPLKISRISLSYNRMSSHTALIKKVMDYLKKTQKDTIVQLNITKKALNRASAKTVGQAFRTVSQTFAELAEIKSLTAVLDRIKIEQNEMSEGQMESRKVEERASAVRDFQRQLDRLREMAEASEKEALLATVLHKDEKTLRRKVHPRTNVEAETTDNDERPGGHSGQRAQHPLLAVSQTGFPFELHRESDRVWAGSKRGR